MAEEKDDPPGEEPPAEETPTEEAPTEIEEEEAPAEIEEEAPAEEAAEEAGEPIQYPLSFKDVLFSFRGRLNRKVYWLKGVLASLVIGLVLQSVVGGFGVFVFGVRMFSVMSTMEPLSAVDLVGGYSRFEKSGGGVVGLVTRHTGPAGLEVEFTAAETTDRINKTVIVGTRRLRITAAKKADTPSYDVDFRWQNYPTAAGAPDMAAGEGWSILEMAVSALGLAVVVLMMWMSFAINIKRLHDRDRKGWWLLVILIPIIGAIGLFVYLGFLKGTEGANRFGPDPLAAEGGD